MTSNATASPTAEAMRGRAGGAIPRLRPASIGILLGIALMTLRVRYMNAEFFPLFDDVWPWARELCVFAGIITNLAMVGLACKVPRALRHTRMNACAVTLLLVGFSATLAGITLPNPLLLGIGCLTSSIGVTWCSLSICLATCELTKEETFLGIPAAFAVAYLLSYALVACGLPRVAVIVVECLILPLAILGLGAAGARVILRSVHDCLPQTDAALLHPASFLPLTNRMFVYMLITTIALAFNLRFGSDTMGPAALLPCLAVFGAVGAWALIDKDHRHFDALFGLVIILVIAGFLTAPLTSMRPLTAVLLGLATACSDTLFQILLTVVASRNKVAGVIVFGWGHSMTSIGSIIGANIGAYVGSSGDSDVAFLVSAAVALLLLSYALWGLKDFSFAATIRDITPLQPLRMDNRTPEELIQGKVDAIAARASLTARESEVLALLARGRNNSYIQEKLVLTRNTVKTYIKRVYVKLDVHSQQELIDLVESAE